MSSCLYKLYSELDNVFIPENFEVSFTFNKGRLGKSGYIRIVVLDKDTDAKITWVVAPKELERCKLDFIRDHIEAMIDSLREDE